MSRRFCAFLLPALLIVAGSVRAAEKLDHSMIGRIRDEGFNRSQVMDTASALCDEIGPRLTGSPSMRKANEWAKKKLTEWGLANARVESWAPFGRGWESRSATLRLVTPAEAWIPAIARAWTHGTDGAVRGKAMRVKLETDEDLAKEKGKLAGKVLLLEAPPEVKPHDKPDAERYTDKTLEELRRFEAGGPARFQRDREQQVKQREFGKKLRKFLEDEKVLAVLTSSARGDDGTVFVQGVSGVSGWKKDELLGPASLAVTAEAYGRIARLLDRKQDVELELDVDARFVDEDPLAAANVLAEIPGSDSKLSEEVVMLGAHLDSWHGATGATDNAAGSAVVLEAVRILRAIGAKPRRTVRVALWTGEEQGLLGSRAYVSTHLASRPEPTDPKERELPTWMRRTPTGPLTTKPAHAKFAAYFNLDNGTGRVRGVYAQENAAVVPIFEEWLKPFRDLGATTVTMRKTGGTDHQSFDGVGLPGFQFIQDELDYDTRTHHSNMDSYERLVKEDLQQASVVMAAFVYNAAMRDEMLPRRPLPPDPPPDAKKDEAKPGEAAKEPMDKPKEPVEKPKEPVEKPKEPETPKQPGTAVGTER